MLQRPMDVHERIRSATKGMLPDLLGVRFLELEQERVVAEIDVRDELAERHKDKRVLEKYRERLKDEHNLQMSLHMQNELDETASKVHMRAG